MCCEFFLKPVWIEVFPLQHPLPFNCVCICVCVNVEARGQPRVLFPRNLAPCFLKHSVSLAWGSLIWLGYLASEPRGSFCLPPLALEVLVTTSGFFKSIFLFFCQFHTCIYWIEVILPHYLLSSKASFFPQSPFHFCAFVCDPLSLIRATWRNMGGKLFTRAWTTYRWLKKVTPLPQMLLSVVLQGAKEMT